MIIGRDGNVIQQEALPNLNSHLHRLEVLTFDQMARIAGANTWVSVFLCPCSCVGMLEIHCEHCTVAYGAILHLCAVACAKFRCRDASSSGLGPPLARA